MRYLFCVNEAEKDNSVQPPETVFLTQKIPDYLAKSLNRAGEEADRAASRHRLPNWLSVTKWLAFTLGMAMAAAVIRSTVSLAQAYYNAPFIFWIGGIALVIAGVLALAEKEKARGLGSSEEEIAAKKRLSEAEAAVRNHLAVPGSMEKAEILVTAWHMTGDRTEFSGLAVNPEIYLFRNDGELCLFDGEGVYSLPQEEMTGIRVVDEAIPLITWNKTEPPGGENFKRAGVVCRDKAVGSLRFFCALELSRGGQEYSLLFPAYELPVLTALTGLPAPELPPVTRTDKIRLKREGREVPGTHRPEDDKVRPLYYWHYPKRAGVFFSPMADVAFRSKHRVLYVLLMLLGIAALVLPMIVFGIAAAWKPITGNDTWMLLGIAGAFVFGVGLFNLVEAWLHQYLGHVVTLVCLFLGSAMMAACWVLIH